MILLIILFFYPTLGVVKFGLAQVVNFRLSFRNIEHQTSNIEF